MYNNYVEIFKCRKYFTKLTQKGLLDAVNSIAKEFAYSDDEELNNLGFEFNNGWLYAIEYIGEYDYNAEKERVILYPFIINGKKEGELHSEWRPF